VLTASEWSITETGGKVLVSFGSIHEWRKARRRTRHSNGQS